MYVRPLISILNEAFFDKVDAVFGTFLEDTFLELWLLPKDGHIEAPARFAGKVERCVAGQNFVSQHTDREYIGFLSNQRC